VRISSRIGRGTYLSMPLTLWLAGWLAVLPFIAAWVLLKLAFAIIRAVIRLAVVIVKAIDGRPVIPAGLRRPPPRRWPHIGPDGARDP
jgi:hypothetical protein